MNNKKLVIILFFNLISLFMNGSNIDHPKFEIKEKKIDLELPKILNVKKNQN